jgi:hypothetical protein
VPTRPPLVLSPSSREGASLPRSRWRRESQIATALSGAGVRRPDISDARFPSSDGMSTAQGTRADPFSEWPTYTANLCPLCGGTEFASLGEDFGEPIRKAVEAAPRRAIW